MNGIDQVNLDAALSDFQNKPFISLLLALVQLSGISTKRLAVKLGRQNGFFLQAEANDCLLREQDVTKSLEILGLSNGLAPKILERWRAYHKERLEKLFAEYHDKPFLELFLAIEKAVGVSDLSMSLHLGKTGYYVKDTAKRGGRLSEEEAKRAMEIFNLKDGLSDEFMARWKNHYEAWIKNPER